MLALLIPVLPTLIPLMKGRLSLRQPRYELPAYENPILPPPLPKPPDMVTGLLSSAFQTPNTENQPVDVDVIDPE